MFRHPRTTRGGLEVFVVDPRPGDYAALVTACAGQGHTFQFAADGHGALRLRPTAERSLWLVNTELPDMAGSDLIEMLRSRWQPTVCLVSDAYDMRQEMAARVLGAAMYVCKPADKSWLAIGTPSEAYSSAYQAVA